MAIATERVGLAKALIRAVDKPNKKAKTAAAGAEGKAAADGTSAEAKSTQSTCFLKSSGQFASELQLIMGYSTARPIILPNKQQTARWQRKATSTNIQITSCSMLSSMMEGSRRHSICKSLKDDHMSQTDQNALVLSGHCSLLSMLKGSSHLPSGSLLCTSLYPLQKYNAVFGKILFI